MADRILIIGAGQAGVEIAATLRDEGFDGELTLVGGEHLGPYQRPPLSKGFLTGEDDEETLEFRAPDFYESRDIRLVTGESIVSIDFSRATGRAVAASGATYEFDKLALTPGSTPRRLLVDGAELDGVLYLRDIEDARELRRRWDSAKDVVVIGGGFIGLEVAAAARRAGKTTSVVEVADRLMARAVAPVTSEYYRGAHERRGISIRLSESISHLVDDGSGHVAGVELTTGEIIPADVVMVGIGVLPRIELAAILGLETINGAIVVDEFAETSDPRVVAAGDAVVLPHPLGGGAHVRLESVQNAVDQAQVAARTLLGRREAYHAVPWFWSDQGDLKLKIAGLSIGHDHVVVRGSLEEDRATVLYYAGEQLLAIDAINQPAEYMVVRRALAKGDNIPRELAADDSVPLKSLVTQP
ncbi:MAG TPA: FAD-dependent oxidoreductase [Microbacterium sp.]|nr:FAD-dependent oxidoreductase [Microbacterium sp.]